MNPNLSDNRIIPWYFVLPFLVVIAVNGVMIWCATSTNLGVVREDAYQRGLHYNDVLHQQKAQDALGWRMTHQLEHGLLSVRLFDAQNQPLHDAYVTAQWIRPLGDAPSITQSLKHTGQGVYAVDAQSLKHGQWAVHVRVQHGTHEVQHSVRVLVR
ncbi:MAG: hypothetical protein EAZ74_03935 [Alphaproteobacteria bacterium]|nr:MAG: hypothetical protein EAY76_05610 [Alphaproteobacteria bacterium]TAF14454.1 MAG: hypothetical protein EAZ74_03935 [Alphaproteobacteria bacterium]TAF38765.1 MAG: hypothetical protein EAZ66_05940 [Alphaproteobacteria bacterium]TAF77607.1 MAG: hypothetical protein EAZ52_00065 [Alphaproteobacteria bacterium]